MRGVRKIICIYANASVMCIYGFGTLPTMPCSHCVSVKYRWLDICKCTIGAFHNIRVTLLTAQSEEEMDSSSLISWITLVGSISSLNRQFTCQLDLLDQSDGSEILRPSVYAAFGMTHIL
jgi:hypothetical protein